jgi:hypothetical protein
MWSGKKNIKLFYLSTGIILRMPQDWLTYFKLQNGFENYFCKYIFYITLHCCYTPQSYATSSGPVYNKALGGSIGPC